MNVTEMHAKMNKKKNKKRKVLSQEEKGQHERTQYSTALGETGDDHMMERGFQPISSCKVAT